MSGNKWLIDIYSHSIINWLSKDLYYQCDKVMLGIYHGFHDSEIDYYFSSYLLNDLEDKDKAFNEAKRIIALYNGILYLLNITHSPIIFTPRIRKNTYFDSTEKLSNEQKEYYKNSLIQRIWDFIEKAIL